MSTSPSDIPASPNSKSSGSSPKSSSPSMPLIVQPTAQDLRHVTSLGGIADARSRRVSGQGRVGSKSPSSIPSSPTSVHSSSSAIFERDIEPLVSISPLIHTHSPPRRTQPLSSSSHQQQPSASTVTNSNPHHSPHPINPHRIPRAQTTAAIEQSVPSVLDSAAQILAGLSDTESDRIEVEAPVPFGLGASSLGSSPSVSSGRPFSGTWSINIGMGKGVGSRTRSSRSPSPSPSPNLNPSLLLSAGKPAPKISTAASALVASSGETDTPTPTLHSHAPPNTAVSPISGSSLTTFTPVLERGGKPVLERIESTGNPPSVVSATPTSAYFSLASSSSPSSRRTSREGSRVGTPSLPSALPPPMVHLDNEPQPQPSLPSTAQPQPQPTSSPSSPTLSPQFSRTSPPPPQSQSQSQSQKRLSFLSYTDLLSSTPTSTLPLSSFTGAKAYAYAIEDPPHLLLNSLATATTTTTTTTTAGSGNPSYPPSPPYSPLVSPVLLGGTGASATGTSTTNPTSSPGKPSTPFGSGSRAPSMRSAGRDRDSLIMLEGVY